MITYLDKEKHEQREKDLKEIWKSEKLNDNMSEYDFMYSGFTVTKKQLKDAIELAIKKMSENGKI